MGQRQETERRRLILASEKPTWEERRCLHSEMMEPAKKGDYYSIELLGNVALAVGVMFGFLLSYYPYSHNPDPSSSVMVPMFSGIALIGFVSQIHVLPARKYHILQSILFQGPSPLSPSVGYCSAQRHNILSILCRLSCCDSQLGQSPGL